MSTDSPSSNPSRRPKRPNRLLAAVAAIATLAGGIGLGFNLRPDENDRAVPSATEVEQATTVVLSDGQTIDLADLPPDSGAALNDAVYPQETTADGVAVQSDRLVGVPTIAAGPIVPNPGGAPDLTPDPEAGVTGTPPAQVSLPDVAAPATPTGRLYDLAATAINLSDSAVAVDSPARPLVPVRTGGGSGAAGVPAFVDPCTISDDGCTDGISGTILADRATPPLQYLGAKEVRWIDFAAPECRRQLPNYDRTRDLMFAMFFNQPVEGTVNVTWPRGPEYPPLSAAVVVRFRTAHTLKVSDAGFSAWHRAFDAGVSIPPVPHCALVPLDSLRPLEADCGQPEYSCTIYPRLQIDLPRLGADFFDPMTIWFSKGSPYYPGSEQLRRAGVRIEPLDDQTIEVRAPVYVETQGLDGVSDGRAGIVVAALYPAGISCEDVNPLSAVLQPVPVSRQLIRTRYWDPDPAILGTREAVIPLTFTGYLGAGETLALCIHWVTQSASSIDDRQIQAIEQHTVVPPLSGSTEIRVTAASPDIDLSAVRLGWVDPSAALLASCFNERVLSSGTLRCVLHAPLFVPPEPVTLHVNYDPGPPPPEGTVTFQAYNGRVTFTIDNRGCASNVCFNPETHRVNMRRGVDDQERWVDVQIIRKPYADLPQLVPVGPRHFGDRDTRRWSIDPWGVSTPPPPVTEATYALEPVLDVVGAYATPNTANPTTAIDVHLRIDRPVGVDVTARARYATEEQCPQVSVHNITLSDRKTITVSGLCPGTTYEFDVLLAVDLDADPVASYPYSARTSRLSATTDRAPVANGYGWAAEAVVVRWSSAGSDSNNRLAPRMENVTGRLIVGPTSSAGVQWVGCDFWGADSLASGLPVAGDVAIDFTMSYEPSCAHTMNTRRVIRVAAWVHWDGVTTLVRQFESDNGAVVEVTLRRIP
ncbi:MAG: hypothetical protein ABL953_01275 [Ilumatobacteraceae bacterium]